MPEEFVIVSVGEIRIDMTARITSHVLGDRRRSFLLTVLSFGRRIGRVTITDNIGAAPGVIQAGFGLP